MKKITFCLLILSFTGVRIHGYSQAKANPRTDTLMEKLIAGSCYSNLRGAQNYNAVVNCFEIVGASLVGVSLETETGVVTAAGVLLGFGGIEMSKSTPIPLTKARRDLDLLMTY